MGASYWRGGKKEKRRRKTEVRKIEREKKGEAFFKVFRTERRIKEAGVEKKRKEGKRGVLRLVSVP